MRERRRPAPAKRPPAYGRELLELRQRGLKPNPEQCYVCIDNWEWAVGRTRVVVAPDADPSQTDFSMLAGLDVIAAFNPRATPAKRRDDVLRALVRAQARRIYAIDMNSSEGSFWVKSAAVGVERTEYA